MGRKPTSSGLWTRWLRNQRSVRIAIFLIATLGTCVIFTAAGLQPLEVWQRLKSWLPSMPATRSAKAPTPLPMGVVEPEPIGTDSSVSKTPVSLVLAATHPGRNAREGYALIGVSAISPQTYSAGALLANGARLLEIYRAYVVLERGGLTTRLYVTGRAPPGYQQRIASMTTVGGAPSTETPIAQADSTDRLTDYIRVSPAFNGNAFSGLTVYPNSRSEVFFRLGLQEGDVITAIDGAALTDQKSAIAALRPLIHGQALTVAVKRGSRVLTIALDGSILF